MIQRIFTTLDKIDSDITMTSSIDIKSLIKIDETSGEISIQNKMMKDYQLHHFLRPIFKDRDQIEILKSRKGFELIKIVSMLRSRINFFFLYNFIDNEQIREKELMKEKEHATQVSCRLVQHENTLLDLAKKMQQAQNA